MRLQIWACEPIFLQSYLMAIQNATLTQIETAKALFGQKTNDDDDEDDDIYDEDGDEAHLSINGVLSQDGPPWIAKLFGFKGTAYRAVLKGIAKAEANPNISKLKLHINSPGGDVQGVDQIWQAIQAFSKPTEAVNEGLMASAAYYIASACDKITASTPNAETGSIGCVFAGIDDTDAMDAAGLKEVKVFSVNATRKDQDIATDKGRAELQLRADAQERNFVDRVATGRGITAKKVNAKFGNGAVFVAEDADPTEDDAISLGMIDGLSTLSSARTEVDDDDDLDDIVAPSGRIKARSQSTATAEGAKTMDLNQFLKENPQALAEYGVKLSQAEAAGAAKVQARIDAAKPYLSLAVTKDGYDATEIAQISKAALDVITGEDEFPALKSFVRLVDMNIEKRKTASAVAETQKQGDTAPNQTDPGVMTEAVAKLGQARVTQLVNFATANQRDINGTLKAELDHVAKMPVRRGA